MDPRLNKVFGTYMDFFVESFCMKIGSDVMKLSDSLFTGVICNGIFSSRKPPSLSIIVLKSLGN